METTPLLPQLAAALGTRDSLSLFAALEDDYFAGLGQLMGSLGLEEPPALVLDQPGLTSALQLLDDHSSEVTQRVGSSGCLAGISEEMIPAVLKSWAAAPVDAPIPPMLRDGCADTLNALAGEGSALAVLSINWCAGLIRATLAPALDVPMQHIWCNSLQPDGTIRLLCPGAVSKRDRICSLVSESAAADNAVAAPDAAMGPVVYIGDSSTDLLALLSADVGILIGESRSARQMARR